MYRLVPALMTLAIGCSEISITPIENDPPVVEVLTHRDGDDVVESYVVLLGGSVTDDRGLDDVTVHWFVDEREICGGPPNEDGGTNCPWPVPEGTDARIRLEARDADGARGNQIVDVTILPNVAPTVTITSPLTPKRYYNNAPVPLEGIAADAEDAPDALAISWASATDGALSADAVPDVRGVFASSSLLSEGEHTLTVTVTDLGGKTGTATVPITVGGANTAPTCELVSPIDGAESGEFNEVLFVGLVDDVDVAPDELTVVFESDVDGIMGSIVPTVNGDVQYPHDTLSLGLHQVTMTVTDDAGVSCQDSVGHLVIEPPSAPAVHIEPADPRNVDDLLCVIDVPSTDPQGDPLTYEFNWLVDGVASEDAIQTIHPGDTVPWVFTGPGQVWTCEGRATDGDTYSSPGTDTVTIATPTVVSVYAGEDHSCLIDTNDTLECWGSNDFGVQNLEGGQYVGVSLGNNHTCGVDINGDIQCVGLDSNGQVTGAPTTGGWETLDAGDAHNCALKNGSITCWGLNDEGQADASMLAGTYTTYSSAFRHNCAVRDDDGLDCWGSDVYGRSTPTPLVTWSQISAGLHHTCGLDLTNEAWCFGRDNHGQSSPLAGTFDAISAGTQVTCGLRGTGVIECWGQETGVGEANEPPAGLFVSVDAGDGHICATTTTGQAECWGNNFNGETDAPLTWW